MLKLRDGIQRIRNSNAVNKGDWRSQLQQELMKDPLYREMNAKLNALLKHDPVFRADMEALNRADLLLDLGDHLAYSLAGSAAGAAASGQSEADWLAELETDNWLVRWTLKREGIAPGEVKPRLEEAIRTLKQAGLWPWQP